jgi:hypothetical protein
MLHDRLNTGRARTADIHHTRRSWSLQIFLWTLWNDDKVQG